MHQVKKKVTRVVRLQCAWYEEQSEGCITVSVTAIYNYCLVNPLHALFKINRQTFHGTK